ncbi:hypothetical protein [Nostoc sp.]|uniref:hypothetical protein n=1 Tax=Nostoc sp. TaxID=1180 RepID=UPI002FF509AB
MDVYKSENPPTALLQKVPEQLLGRKHCCTQPKAVAPCIDSRSYSSQWEGTCGCSGDLVSEAK